MELRAPSTVWTYTHPYDVCTTAPVHTFTGVVCLVQTTLGHLMMLHTSTQQHRHVKDTNHDDRKIEQEKKTCINFTTNHCHNTDCSFVGLSWHHTRQATTIIFTVHYCVGKHHLPMTTNNYKRMNSNAHTNSNAQTQTTNTLQAAAVVSLLHTAATSRL
eukprot:Lankesteria_metandrocarpae@DN8625_c0_g1_i1.p1